MDLLLVSLGLLAGALVTWLALRALHASSIAKTIAETESRLRTAHSKTEAESEALKARLDAETRRATDLAAELATTRQTLSATNEQLTEARREIAALHATEASFKTRLEELGTARTQLEHAFQSLGAQALQKNNEQFLQLARTELERLRTAARTDLDAKESAIEQLVKPIRDSLTTYDAKLVQIEKDRTESFASLAEKLQHVQLSNEKLAAGTNDLTRALKSSNVRGAWGELQLRRVVELAGMLDHCDFEMQATTASGQRPDLLVRLPGDGVIVIDAKTPMLDLLDAVNQPDESAQHAACAALVGKIRGHAKTLRDRAYWSQFDRAPEFVVLFLPSEAFLSIALTHDRDFFEESFQHRVLLATPTTLIALLKTAALGWRQEAIARNAQEISDLGRQLYERIATVGGHLDDLGRSLEKSVKSYNSAVGSIESRLLVSGRRFRDLGAGTSKDIAVLEPVGSSPVALSAPELRPMQALPVQAPVEIA